MSQFTPFVLCIILAGALAQSPFRIMTVTVPRPEVTANIGSDVKLPCSYSIPAAGSGLKPTINWYKGDDGIATATKIFSLSYHGPVQVPEAYGEFVGRVSLENPAADATLKLTGARTSDQGRYWCAVFDSDEHNQLGMDSKSVLLTVIDPNVPQDQGTGRPGHVELHVPAQRQVFQGEDVLLPCECDDCHWTSHKTWFSVSFDNTWAATREVIATVGLCGGHQCHGGNAHVAPAFQDRFAVSTGGLKISATKRLDTRRYWCQVEDMTMNSRGCGVDAQSVALAVVPSIPESHCTGKPAGVYQHPDDCAKFYTCAEGGVQYDGVNTCPDGLYYDQALGYCEWASLVTCL
ncbi:Hypp3861 [Branchiostoma lanceolatum]|uniref:chitinase n=1 Tax=Branchiostoma lanceolatum TaxID=7740 RepID=A0A8K0EW67_BRALA|nr:Hypp3861 [Branchiostoma lanceolatum]